MAFSIDGGVLVVDPSDGYPISPIGLPAGAVWSNGGAVAIVPGITPNPLAPKVYYPEVTPAYLRSIGGGNLPTTPGPANSGQLWSNGGEVTVSGVGATLFDMSWAEVPIWRSTTINSYLYVQYNDDDDLQAFVGAYNGLAQEYVNWFTSIQLPVYTNPNIQGLLLDWIGTNLYGNPRPVLPSGNPRLVGPYNTYGFNSVVPFNVRKTIGPTTFFATSDDVYKRCLTWNFFKGDGRVWNVRYFKRRMMRFLDGPSGIDFDVCGTWQISVSFGVGNQVNVRLLNGIRSATGGAIYNRHGFNQRRYNQLNTQYLQLVPLTYASVLKAAMDSRAVELPFQFVFNIEIEGSTGPGGGYLYTDGGVLCVSAGAGYPTAPTGLAPGAVWSNGGSVAIVPGITPDPSAPPVYFGLVTAAQLLELGGGNLPLSAGSPGSNQLWNNDGEATIS